MYGPREILPASLWPGLTIGGSAVRAWQTSEKRAINNNRQLSSGGIWLPSLESSDEDLSALTRRAEKFTNQDELIEALARVAIKDSGCWTTETDDPQLIVHDAATMDVGAKILESLPKFDELQQCDTPDCVYPRHYDFTYGVPSGRRELLYPNLDYFRPAQNGDILTAWGDRLPSIASSRTALADFQMKCQPYVTRAESPLTVSGIAQLSLLPDTGCWFVRSYYMTPVGMSGYENWQYDGYGRLKLSAAYESRPKEFPSYAMLAHRALWVATGNKLKPKAVLNHMCGFRPCANPAHIEQVTSSRNNTHGRHMALAGYAVEQGDIAAVKALKIMATSKARHTNLDEFYSC